jgi:hypothetical protein
LDSPVERGLHETKNGMQLMVVKLNDVRAS